MIAKVLGKERQEAGVRTTMTEPEAGEGERVKDTMAPNCRWRRGHSQQRRHL